MPRFLNGPRPWIVACGVEFGTWLFSTNWLDVQVQAIPARVRADADGTRHCCFKIGTRDGICDENAWGALASAQAMGLIWPLPARRLELDPLKGAACAKWIQLDIVDNHLTRTSSTIAITRTTSMGRALEVLAAARRDP